MGKRSGSGITNGGGGSGGGNRELTDAQMQSELDKHFAEVDEALDKFMASKAGARLEDVLPDDYDGYGVYLEKSTIQELKSDYIDELNDTLKDYGSLFTFADDDTNIYILYKSGKSITVSPQWWDEKKKIPTSNIDSIIVSGGWGTAIAGKNIEIYNMRETVEYGKYGYKDLKARYNDYDDIRVDFK